MAARSSLLLRLALSSAAILALALALPPAEAQEPKADEGPPAADAPKTKAAPPKSAPDAKAEVPVRVTSIRHVVIRARDLRLTKTSRERLERIAARYHAATRKDLVVTGGTRSTKRQAELMIAKLDNGDDISKLYEQKAACAEIVATYKAATGEGKKKRRVGVLERVRDVIDAQVARGVFVSKHLQSGATDVRSRDMSPARVRRAERR